VKLNLIIIAESDGDSTLRVLRIAFGDFLLGYNENASSFGKTYSGAETGNPASDHDEVCLGWKRCHKRKLRW
jgi:hypothetical protein